MLGLAALMIISMYVGIFFLIFYGIKFYKYRKEQWNLILNPVVKEEDLGYKVLPPVDPSIVIEKHSLLSKIDKMLNACNGKLSEIKGNLESKEDYQVQRELEAVIKSYEEIKNIEINDRISLDYASYLFNDGKLRSAEDIEKFDETIQQAKYVSSGDFYKEIIELDEHTYFSRRILFGLLMFASGFVPTAFYGLIDNEGFFTGFFRFQKIIIYGAMHPFQNGIAAEIAGLFAIFPYIICFPFAVGAFVMLHAGLEIEHNVKENICRKKAGMKPRINKNTIIAGVACIPTLIRILK